MKVAGGWIGKPGWLRRRGVCRERGCAAIEGDDGFVREVVADQAAGSDVAVLNRVGVVASEIQRIVVNLSTGGGFQRDAWSWVAAGSAVVGNEVVLDLAAGMS